MASHAGLTGEGRGRREERSSGGGGGQLPVDCGVEEGAPWGSCMNGA
jgi:hypothetical protein